MVIERRGRRAAGLLALALWLGAGAGHAAAQTGQAGAGTGLEVVRVTDDVYLIAGAGSNITVQIGVDGVILVDTGLAQHAEQVLAEIRKLTDRPIKYIINTSADPDHVGGNDVLSAAGEPMIPTGGLNDIGAFGGRAMVLAEEHVLARMSAPHGQEAPFPYSTWPTNTYSSDLHELHKDMYLNRQAVQTFYQPAAHSDGDSIVFFRRSDVIATGDVFDMTRFPVINIDEGGSVQGVIDSLNRLIDLAVPATPLTWVEGGTIVIPGHGRACRESEVVDYRDMVTIIRDRVQDLIGRKAALEQIQRANPTQGYRARFGSDSGPWTTNQFVEAVYESLTAR
jgi:glyoxylase-like metal-dependent hydrolase (beta-lactamase superfamily II)